MLLNLFRVNLQTFVKLARKQNKNKNKNKKTNKTAVDVL